MTMTEKLNEARETLNEKMNDTIFWIRNNPESFVAILGASIPLVSAIDKMFYRNYRKYENRKESRKEDRYIYDRSTGLHYYTRRRMSPNDKLEIERRKRNGEPMGLILRSMRLI